MPGPSETDRKLVSLMLRCCKAETLRDVYKAHPEIASQQDWDFVKNEIRECMLGLREVMREDFKNFRPEVQERIMHNADTEEADWFAGDDPKLKFHRID